MRINAVGYNYLLDTIASYEQDSGAAAAKDDLGRDDFLTLLVAQLEHQDPLNPMESSEFTSQLAQYSSLEQLFDINGNLEIMRTDQEQNLRYQAIDFIGKEIVAEGNILSWAEGRTAEGGFTLGDQGDCEVLIYDFNGNTIRKIPLGNLEAGEHRFDWDGCDDSGNTMENGTYYFEVSTTSGEGQVPPLETQITGLITRVNLQGDLPTLYVGEIPIPLTAAVEIRNVRGD